MKNIAIMAAFGLMVAGTASAQMTADQLNARELQRIAAVNAVRAPAVAPVATTQATTLSAPGGFYIGAATGWGGAHLDSRAQWNNSLRAGYQLNRFVSVEASADLRYRNSTQSAGQLVFGNALVGLPLGQVTPYLLAGAGVGLNGSGNANRDPQSLWNVGGGMAYNVNRNWQVDSRYRYVDAWQGSRDAEHVFSVGVNYRF